MSIPLDSESREPVPIHPHILEHEARIRTRKKTSILRSRAQLRLAVILPLIVALGITLLVTPANPILWDKYWAMNSLHLKGMELPDEQKATDNWDTFFYSVTGEPFRLETWVSTKYLNDPETSDPLQKYNQIVSFLKREGIACTEENTILIDSGFSPNISCEIGSVDIRVNYMEGGALVWFTNH